MEPLRDDSGLPLTEAVTWQPRRKFQDRVWLHVLLLLLTVATTTLVGTDQYLGFLTDFARPVRLPGLSIGLLLNGLWYSATILAILGCHELGHYVACRYYDVDASLPFFLPVPISITGTLGGAVTGTLTGVLNTIVDKIDVKISYEVLHDDGTPAVAGRR